MYRCPPYTVERWIIKQGLVSPQGLAKIYIHEQFNRSPGLSPHTCGSSQQGIGTVVQASPPSQKARIVSTWKV